MIVRHGRAPNRPWHIPDHRLKLAGNPPANARTRVRVVADMESKQRQTGLGSAGSN